MKKISFLFLLTIAVFMCLNTQAQIYEPEGINMPGSWNAWENPPINDLVLASSTQVTDGEIIRRTTGLNSHYHTIIHCATTGGDLVPGDYQWLFTSGPNNNPDPGIFNNKWADATVIMNTLQDYVYQGANDNTVSLIDNRWYTVNYEDAGYNNTRAIFMETSAEPVALLTVSEPSNVNPDTDIPITITSNANLTAEEYVYICYTTDNWTSAQAVTASFTGTSGTATIPGQPTNTGVLYFAFSSTMSGITADFGLQSIDINDNAGAYYSINIGDPPPATITWANLQWPASGEIEPGAQFIVYGQVYIFGVTDQDVPSPDLQAWVGYSTSDTDPSTWTNWVAAPYLGNVGDNDEYSVDLGAEITTEGTYYYATRFKYLDQDYVYGGFDGGFWDGTNNVSGVLTVTNDPTPDEIDWCNLENPADGEIEPLNEFLVYGQVYIENITNSDDEIADLDAWIGWSNTDSDPATWTNWIAADFGSNQGNNDEYVANLGGEMSVEGTFYYATRYKYLNQDYVYGGYSASGGNFWDGTNYVSGELVVTNDPTPDEINWCNLQWPPNGDIEPQGEFFVYGQVYIENVTNANEPVTDLIAWIGVSSTDSDPSSWTTWYPMSFSANIDNNDEYIIDLGEEMLNEGTFYYATRFQYLNQDYVYGGYNISGGGFWNGTDNASGVLIVNEDPVGDTIAWANLQWPPTGEILPNEEFTVFGQAFIDGVTTQFDSLTDLQVWVGYNDANTDPAGWTNWLPAWYLQADGDNDEYATDLGSMMGTLGTYYYATRFQYEDQDFVYGGFSDLGGDFWDGVDNVSGVLTVTNDPAPDTIGWCNLQWPPNGSIEPNAEFIVYAQAWIDGVTSQADSLVDLQAWIGYSVTNTNPAEWTEWIPAWYSNGDGDNDEYLSDLGAAMGTDGTYYYATRFQYLDQEFVYGGYSANGGGFWDGTDNVNGVLTVGEGTDVFPVEFVVTDATGLYSNIKFKGDMTSWSTVDMQQDGDEWSVTLDISPGTYEWGVIEDDGTANGIWLIIGDNLVVAVDDEGNISGDTTYTITFVGIDELESTYQLYPNPVNDQLWIKHASDKTINIRLLDATGKLVNEMTSSEKQILLEMQDLTNGLYFLEINDNDRQFRSKIIKQ